MTQETINIEELIAQAKAEERAKVISELATRKKSDSVWRKAKAKFCVKVQQLFPKMGRAAKLVDHIGHIGAIVSGYPVAASYKENDIEWVEGMFDDFFGVAVKYRKV